ncbi:phosphate ABC transporter permease subunit PstC [Methanoculleus sp. MH98A]|uniref:phosphate ABC transporter permease subunit PstC n=1 Tax=Methanoculleus sp. MH98A TaxID=1495314 RepID=UPI00049EF345|nr:phosphate ABC transporter permease subunit PstC [Methanoculleus sp. MH98A]KDE56589.1 phosphate ABC transporter permease [Methanoculleus sp. MH98A]
MKKEQAAPVPFRGFGRFRRPEAGIDPSSAGATRQLVDKIVGKLLFLVALFAIITVFFIIVFLLRDGYQIVLETGVWSFLTGPDWNPAGYNPAYGALPLIVGTVLVTALAMVIAVPLSIGTAIYIAEIAGPRTREVIKPAVELLAGIPSVVYGFFGLILLTDWIRIAFDQPSGSSWLAGSILLAIMAIPTITSVAEDAIGSVPREFREGSLALGATHWQTIRMVVVPGALSGIGAAIILGMGRAIGETMAVLMVTGNAAVIPDPITDVFSPVRTLTGTLGIEMGEVAFGSLHYHALFGVAVVLLVITLVVNSAARLIVSRMQGTARPGPHRALTAVASRITHAASAPFGRVVPPRTSQRGAFLLMSLSVAIVLAALGVILAEIVVNGAGAITWEFLTGTPSDLGREGGIFPAIAGTLYLVGGALAIALPLGIATAVYLIEYTGDGPLTRSIRAAVDLLNGTPSIVFGLFGFAFLVLFMGFGVSMIAGQITLGLMILPTIIRTTEESLRSIPGSLREGSYALGATKWQTISRVVLPPALPGILTGAILSIGRAAGETAPIMFTAVIFSSRHLPSSLTEPVMALPYHLFILTTSVPGASAQKFGTAFVLLLLVLSIYLAAILVRRRYNHAKVM